MDFVILLAFAFSMLVAWTFIGTFIVLTLKELVLLLKNLIRHFYPCCIIHKLL